MIENQHLVIFSWSVEQLQAGEAKNKRVTLSTAGAEYVTLASAAQEAMRLRHLISDLPNGATVIFENNQAAICMAENPQLHGRAKHIDIKYHFIREQVNSG